MTQLKTSKEELTQLGENHFRAEGVNLGDIFHDALQAHKLKAIIEDIEEPLHRIIQWLEAYPTDVFPEPDLKKAAKILKENGMTLDSISGHVGRHIGGGIKGYADEIHTIINRGLRHGN